MAQEFDVVVIGAGPAGYIGAIRAAQLGLKTACIEEWKTPDGKPALGGTCLNVGCIPSKALLQSSEQYERTLHSFGTHGISVTGTKLDLKKMLGRKDSIVAKMTGGIEYLFKKNKITWLKGHGKLAGKGGQGWSVEVVGDAGSETVITKSVIIATGSRARHLPGIAVDNEVVCDNIGALAFSDVPKTLGVIGAGVIGLELGSVWRRLGSKVTILEALPGFLAAADETVSKEAWKQFTREQSLDIQLGVKIGKVTAGKKGVVIDYELDGAAKKLECDRLIVSVGRIPNTANLGAETVGLKIDERGLIEVDDHCRTNLPNIFAVGDVVRGPMLAHKGEEEGVMVAEIIAGQKGHVNYDDHSLGDLHLAGNRLGRQDRAGAESRGHSLQGRPVPLLGQRPRAGAGRHRRLREDAGARQDRSKSLVCTYRQHHASELIAEAVVAMEFRASAEDIARIVHAHPSLSEVMHEAALAVDKRALHF